MLKIWDYQMKFGSSGSKGIVFRKHPKNKINGQADRYWILRIWYEGNRLDRSVGWESSGWTFELVKELLQGIKEEVRRGSHPDIIKKIKPIYLGKINEDIHHKVSRFLLPKLTYLDAYNEFEKWMKTSCSTKTRSSYQSKFKVHILPYFEERELSSISKKDFIEFRLELEKKELKSQNVTCQQSATSQFGEEASKKKLAPRTVKGIMTLAREVLHYCSTLPISPDYPNNMMYENEALFVQTPFSKFNLFPKDNSIKKRVLTGAELNLILQYSKKVSLDQYDVTRIALETGMRVHEVVELKKEHVIMDRRELYVPQGKGKERHVLFHRSLDKIIGDRLGLNSRWLFPSYGKSHHLTSQHISRTFSNISKKIKLNNGITDRTYRATFHTLRTTYAVNMIVSGGMDLANLSLQLGHASPETTKKYYLPLLPKDRGRFIENAYHHFYNKIKF